MEARIARMVKVKRVIKINSLVGEEGGGRSLWEGLAQETTAAEGERQRFFLYLGNRDTRMSRPKSWLDAGGANSDGVGLNMFPSGGNGRRWRERDGQNRCSSFSRAS